MARAKAVQEQPRVEVTYKGPIGNHLVPSPTRKVATYGMHTNGDVFLVHPDDQAAMPKVFVLVKQIENPDAAAAAAPAAEKNAKAAPKATADGAVQNKATTKGETPVETPVKATTKAATEEKA